MAALVLTGTGRKDRPSTGDSGEDGGEPVGAAPPEGVSTSQFEGESMMKKARLRSAYATPSARTGGP